MYSELWNELKSIPSDRKKQMKYSEDEIMQPYTDYVNKCTVLDVKPQYKACYNHAQQALCISEFKTNIKKLNIVISKRVKRLIFSNEVEDQLVSVDKCTTPLITIKGAPTLIVRPYVFMKLVDNGIILIEKQSALLRIYLQLIYHIRLLYDKNDDFYRIVKFTKILLNNYKTSFNSFEPAETAYSRINYLLSCMNYDCVYNELDLISILDYIEDKTNKLLHEVERNEQE